MDCVTTSYIFAAEYRERVEQGSGFGVPSLAAGFMPTRKKKCFRVVAIFITLEE